MKRIVSIAAVLLSAGTASADARPLPAAQWDQATQLTLAQVMVGEADWHEPDHVAIAYVLARRWQHYQQAKGPIAFQRYMQLYSSTMKVDTERARWVRALPWGELPGPHQKRWSRVLDLVKAWGAGKVDDPCPEAEHWGGAMDRPGRSWQPVSCGLTKNIFYGPREKSLALRERRGEKAKASALDGEASREKRKSRRAAEKADEPRDGRRDTRAARDDERSERERVASR